MKRLSAAFATLCILVMSLVSCGGALTTSSPPLSVPQIVSHEGNSTVALVFTDVDNDDDEVSDVRATCTAVWVDDKHILTALHCAKGEQRRQQKMQDNKEANREECEPIAILLGLCDPEDVKEHKVIGLQGLSMHFVQWKEVDDVRKEPTAQHLAHVVGWDSDHDLALLEAAGNAIPSHEVAKVAQKVPGMGERVHVVGHPKGFYWTFLEGTMAGYRGDIPGLQPKKLKDGDTRNHGPYMQLQVPIYFGNSGGGAFNDNGELIGIADFLLGLPSEGFFVPVDVIRAFLVDQEVLPGKKKVEKKEEAKPVQPTVNVTVVAVTPPAPPANAPPPEKADVIPAPPLPIPLPKISNGSLGSVPAP